jgi:phage FluMu protein Com
LRQQIGGVGIRCAQCGEVLVGGSSYIRVGFDGPDGKMFREFDSRGKVFAERRDARKVGWARRGMR